MRLELLIIKQITFIYNNINQVFTNSHNSLLLLSVQCLFYYQFYLEELEEKQSA